MARKTKEELDILKKKHGVNRVWSWSRFNCYNNSPFEYYLKYVANEPEDAEPSIYGVQGGLVHEMIEDLYLGKIKYEDMPDKYEEILFELQMQGLKYNRINEESNKKIGDNYENCIREFCKNHKIIKEKVHIEKFIDIKVGKHLFQGYIDAVAKIGDKVCIIDWKTSTEYKGKKAEKEIGQLKLYAYGLYKKGIKADDILYGWNFLKYYTFKYTQNNGKQKSMNIERNIDPLDMASIRKNVEDRMLELGYNIDDYHRFKDLPNEVQELYSLEDCYTFFSVTSEELDEYAKEIELKVDGIIERELNSECEDDWMGETIDASNAYYFNNIGGYTFKKHKPFSEYIEMSRMFMIDED